MERPGARRSARRKNGPSQIENFGNSGCKLVHFRCILTKTLNKQCSPVPMRAFFFGTIRVHGLSLVPMHKRSVIVMLPN